MFWASSSKQFGLRQVNIRETQVESRFELVFCQLTDLCLCGLACTDVLLRYFEQSLSLKRVEERLIGCKNDIFGCGKSICILSFLLKLRGGYKIAGSAEVGNELRKSPSRCRMLEKTRGRERTCGDAAAILASSAVILAVPVGSSADRVSRTT